MKIWHGFGSEHSMNLVMIGHFKTAEGAMEAKWIIDQLTEHVMAETEAGEMVIGARSDRYSDKMLELLQRLKFHDIAPADLEQFGYEFDMKANDDRVVITTDESDVSAFLKILVGKGARVEVYSAHDYSDTDYGRGK